MADLEDHCAFVCYAQESVEDARFAQRLIADLGEVGIDVVNRENRQEGAMAEDTIARLQESQWVILVQTPAALRSPQVQFTIDAALDLVQQRCLHGVLAMIAVSHSWQDIPPTWATLKTFDASEDYAKAFARLQLALSPVLSAAVPSAQMCAAPPPAFQPMMATSVQPAMEPDAQVCVAPSPPAFQPIMATSVQSAMEPDDKPARFMPLWLRKKQLKSWLVPLSAVLALMLVAGVSMEAFAMIMRVHAAQPVVARKNITLMMPTRVVTRSTVELTPTPTLKPTPTRVAIQSLAPAPTPPPVAVQPLAPTPTPTLEPTPTPVATQPPAPTPTPSVAEVAQSLYANITQQQPALTDSLSAQDGNNWDTPADGSCAFANNSYSVNATQPGTWTYCLARSTSFSNFAFQVQMTYSASLPSHCGLVFRANTAADMYSSYRLYVSSDGSYELDGYQQVALAQGTAASMNTGQANNTIAVIADNNDIYLYANGKVVTHVSDNAATSGAIGMVCKVGADEQGPSGALFQSAQVWTF